MPFTSSQRSQFNLDRWNVLRSIPFTIPGYAMVSQYFNGYTPGEEPMVFCQYRFTNPRVVSGIATITQTNVTKRAFLTAGTNVGLSNVTCQDWTVTVSHSSGNPVIIEYDTVAYNSLQSGFCGTVFWQCTGYTAQALPSVGTDNYKLNLITFPSITEVDVPYQGTRDFSGQVTGSDGQAYNLKDYTLINGTSGITNWQWIPPNRFSFGAVASDLIGTRWGVMRNNDPSQAIVGYHDKFFDMKLVHWVDTTIAKGGFCYYPGKITWINNRTYWHAHPWTYVEEGTGFLGGVWEENGGNQRIKFSIASNASNLIRLRVYYEEGKHGILIIRS